MRVLRFTSACVAAVAALAVLSAPGTAVALDMGPLEAHPSPIYTTADPWVHHEYSLRLGRGSVLSVQFNATPRGQISVEWPGLLLAHATSNGGWVNMSFGSDRAHDYTVCVSPGYGCRYGLWYTVQHAADSTAPVTASDCTGLYLGSASITLLPKDDDTGARTTYWALTGPENRSGQGTDVLASTPGTYQLQFWSDDFQGNTEAPKTTSFTVLASPATTTITIRTPLTSTRVGNAPPVLMGAVSPRLMIGKCIVVYVKKPGKRYWSYSSNRTVYSLNGEATWQYKYFFKSGMAKGVYYFRAVAPAPLPSSAGFASSTSGVVAIRLR